MRRAAAALLVLALAVPASASFRASGYLKTVYQYSHGTLDGRPYNLDTSRARLTLDDSQGLFRAHADYDQQLAAGSYFRTADFKAYGYAPPSPWLTMQGTISTGTLNGYGHGAYRAWLGFDGDAGTVRVGRQRIAWGTGKIWDPTDVLNPYQPTAVERDERRGVDAAYARLGIGDLGQAELVWAPDDTWVDHALLARGRNNIAGWDFSLMGGKVAGSTASVVLGGDFAGTVLEGTLHGEWVVFRPQYRADYWKGDIGYDYTVPTETKWRWLKDAAFVVEYLHAGNGTKDVRLYDYAPVLAGTENTVAQDYVAGTFSKDLHPLVKLELYGVANADDASTFFAPALTYNALENLYLSAAVQRFGGTRRTEYGRLPNQLILSAQYYF
jgi:hypothetical protein